MSINAAITHRTTYRYDRLISLGAQVVRLRPAPHSRTKILAYSQKISPDPHFINWQQDPFGNWLARLVFPEKVDHFEVTVDLVADMAAVNPFDFFVDDDAREFPFEYSPEDRKDLAPYLETAPQGPLFEALLARLPDGADHTVDWLVEVNQLVQQAVAYRIRMEPGVQTPEDTLKIASGSCRDSGWLLVHLLRRRGLAARFVSGYLIQLTPDVKSATGPSGPEADFTDLHAWTEVYVPGAGWIGLDPTSGLFASEGHIPLAATPSPRSAAPITGGHEAAEVSFDFHMEINRVREEPRVTRPFSDAAWEALNHAGRAVDARLKALNIPLTMGGEPTFVAESDRDAPEWNEAAIGPTKRLYADRLIRRLRDRFAPDGLLQHGQGKWYPGEELPRWALSLVWRKDGEPMWTQPELLAEDPAPGAPKGGADDASAERFAGALAEALEVAPDHVQRAYEDPAPFVLREAELPINVDAVDNKLENPLERKRLAKVFERGLGKPAAWVLPVQPQQAQAVSDGRRRRFSWKSEGWKTRRGRLFMTPGDGAAGYRLPLSSLPYLEAIDRPGSDVLDPFARRGQFPPAPQSQRIVARAQGRSPEAAAAGASTSGPAGPGHAAMPFGPAGAAAPAQGFGGPEPDPGIAIFAENVRTAVTVEPQDGVLRVFMPPLPSADAFVDLIGAVEDAARAIQTPVQIEGYAPPSDPRLQKIMVTPDPGVVEVNVQPAASWDEQAAITEGLYEDAKQVGLATTKFMYDGRQTGSGGGNHIVFGGATPSESPFLNRPDLLASIVRYWQVHPSLSFLFSGQFIGPTSQAPRVDEARDDILYELEIALEQVPGPGEQIPLWLVDRVFRNLLTDATGNTHRAEICIDKLYSPDGPAGRLGLVEFRAFEMPSHPRMSLAQALVLRALIAWFWETPFTRPLRRFGPALHDRYMLPHFVWQDFSEVLEDLRAAHGLAFDPEWFRAQFEFRFPLAGDVRHGGVTLELRHAIEPWHVLGETGAIGG
ncbi:MAG: transglutaminase family protein, partial [Pseudomonadota bacterium]